MYTKYRAKDIHTGEWLCGEFSDRRDYVKIWAGPYSKEVDKNTLGMCINYQDDFGNDIYTGDIVQISTFATFLVWFCNESQCLEAVRLDDGEVYCNKPSNSSGIVDCDFHNMQRIVEYVEFCLMLQDPYGDFTGKIKVIGNIFDNPELVEAHPIF